MGKYIVILLACVASAGCLFPDVGSLESDAACTCLQNDAGVFVQCYSADGSTVATNDLWNLYCGAAASELDQ